MDRLKIGISACYLYPDPARAAFAKKTLNYVEQSVPHWVMSGGALPVMILPTTGETARGDVTLDDYAAWLDGLVLHGGADLWPGSYGEQPIDSRWQGDRLRDEYEMALVKAFVDTGAVEVIFMDYGLQEVLYEHAKQRGVSEDDLDELFQYPRGRGRSHGIIRHWRSHQHHFHVRFRS